MGRHRGLCTVLLCVVLASELLLVAHDDLLFRKLSSHIHAPCSIDVEWLTLKR